MSQKEEIVASLEALSEEDLERVHSLIQHLESFRERRKKPLLESLMEIKIDAPLQTLNYALWDNGIGKLIGYGQTRDERGVDKLEWTWAEGIEEMAEEIARRMPVEPRRN